MAKTDKPAAPPVDEPKAPPETTQDATPAPIETDKPAAPPVDEPFADFLVIVATRNPANTLNVRSAPYADALVVDTLPSGFQVTVHDEADGWYHIGDGRWIMASLTVLA
jgi:uncharacterized protein YgiM (DUF1202 family)